LLGDAPQFVPELGLHALLQLVEFVRQPFAPQRWIVQVRGNVQREETAHSMLRVQVQSAAVVHKVELAGRVSDSQVQLSIQVLVAEAHLQAEVAQVGHVDPNAAQRTRGSFVLAHTVHQERA
jgi:hypothetical protein